MKKYYQILGLDENASEEKIQKAYDKLSAELDPKNNDNQDFFKEEFQKVQQAYKALIKDSILSISGVDSDSVSSEDKDSTKQNNNNNSKTNIEAMNTNNKIRDLIFGILLGTIGLGIWGVFLQNMGFFIPSDDYTQKVRVINTVDTRVNNTVDVYGNVKVNGSVSVDNTVDINLMQIRGTTPWINTSETGSAVLGVYSEETTLGK